MSCESLEVTSSAPEFAASPYALAFIRAAQQLRLGAAAAAAAPCSFALACEAIDTVEPWRVDGEDVLDDLHTFSRRPQTVEYAEQLAEVATSSWWSASLDRSCQGWFSRNVEPPTAAAFKSVHQSPTPWERYAQKPESCLWTSTVREGTTAAVAAVQAAAGDLGAAGPVASLWVLSMGVARVYEIGSAEDWHRLCHEYPSRADDGRLVPHWPAVAEAWDAVHLSFCGAMTATGVRVDSGAGWTMLTGWDVEQTVWLRWRVQRATRAAVPPPARCGGAGPADIGADSNC